MSDRQDAATEQKDPDEMGIQELAREYMRAVNDHEARKEGLLADLAGDYYQPGYLDDDDWDLLKRLINAQMLDGAMTIIEVAAHRKVATEAGREDELDDDWPAKSGGIDA